MLTEHCQIPLIHLLSLFQFVLHWLVFASSPSFSVPRRNFTEWSWSCLFPFCILISSFYLLLPLFLPSILPTEKQFSHARYILDLENTYKTYIILTFKKIMLWERNVWGKKHKSRLYLETNEVFYMVEIDAAEAKKEFTEGKMIEAADK